jgi:hypothetical protein
MRFVIGSRVWYFKVNPYYSLGLANPLKGTVFECAGTVTYLHGKSVHVTWDNGTTNSYHSDYLSLVAGSGAGHPLTKIFK